MLVVVLVLEPPFLMTEDVDEIEDEDEASFPLSREWQHRRIPL